jgi:hypothetical protein
MRLVPGVLTERLCAFTASRYHVPHAIPTMQRKVGFGTECRLVREEETKKRA